jgi:predicted nuclease with TOPRIM domain
MREQLEERVASLQGDFDRGNERLKQLEDEADKLRETLLRIAGAVQVLTEELKRSEDAGDGENAGPA